MANLEGIAPQPLPINKRIFVPAVSAQLEGANNFAPALDSTGLPVLQLAASLTGDAIIMCPSSFRDNNPVGQFTKSTALSTVTGVQAPISTYGDSLLAVDIIYQVLTATATSLLLTLKSIGLPTISSQPAAITETTLVTSSGLILTADAAHVYRRASFAIPNNLQLLSASSVLTALLNAVTPASSIINIAGLILSLNASIN